jgi:hypothetical protein
VNAGSRAALDERLARILADALVRELRSELTQESAAVHGEPPAADQSDAGAMRSEVRADDATSLPTTRAS